MLYRYWQSVGHAASEVGAFVEVCAARDPEASLEVRAAFRSDTGILRPHIVCKPDLTLDQYHAISLSEEAFNKLLALPADREVMAFASFARMPELPR